MVFVAVVKVGGGAGDGVDFDMPRRECLGAEDIFFVGLRAGNVIDADGFLFLYAVGVDAGDIFEFGDSGRLNGGGASLDFVGIIFKWAITGVLEVFDCLEGIF